MSGKKKKKSAKAPQRGLGPILVAAGAGGGFLVIVVAWVVFGRGLTSGDAGAVTRGPKLPAGQVAVADLPAGASWKVEPDAAEAPAPGARSAFVLADTVRPEG